MCDPDTLELVSKAMSHGYWLGRSSVRYWNNKDKQRAWIRHNEEHDPHQFDTAAIDFIKRIEEGG